MNTRPRPSCSILPLGLCLALVAYAVFAREVATQQRLEKEARGDTAGKQGADRPSGADDLPNGAA